MFRPRYARTMCGPLARPVPAPKRNRGGSESTIRCPTAGLLKFGVRPASKVLDLMMRGRCRRRGARGRTAVSVKWGSQSGQTGKVKLAFS